MKDHAHFLANVQVERTERARTKIDAAFTWVYSPEGFDYWNLVTKKLYEIAAAAKHYAKSTSQT